MSYLALDEVVSWQGNYRYFTEQEMKCKCGCGALPPHEFMLRLDGIREVCGFPLYVNSGARCPDYNKEVSNTGLTGPHTMFDEGFCAADIAVFHEQAFLLIPIAIEEGMQGIGIKQTSGSSYGSRFIHLDDIPRGYSEKHVRPTVWSY